MAATKEQLRSMPSSPRNLPSGIDLMRKINNGVVDKVPSEYLKSVRELVSESCDELIEIGARIRPLMVDGKQLGWVRGLHSTERRRLARWVQDPNEFVINSLTLATSLKREEIEDFSSLEIHNMVELIQTMTGRDASLYPYLSAFTSTMTSENLWHGRGTQLTSFEGKKIEMPDGKIMKVLVPSEHARLWATLCVYREQAKVRMDANWNAVLQVRPMAGKSVDPLAAELKALAKQLATDSMEPWENSVAFVREVKDDGWAHVENINDRTGMLKEMHGMLEGDKHEQFFEIFEGQQIEAAEARRKQLETIVSRNGGPGITTESVWIETPEEIHKREMAIRQGRFLAPADRNKMETTLNPVEKLERYK